MMAGGGGGRVRQDDLLFGFVKAGYQFAVVVAGAVDFGDDVTDRDGAIRTTTKLVPLRRLNRQIAGAGAGKGEVQFAGGGAYFGVEGDQGRVAGSDYFFVRGDGGAFGGGKDGGGGGTFGDQFDVAAAERYGAPLLMRASFLLSEMLRASEPAMPTLPPLAPEMASAPIDAGGVTFDFGAFGFDGEPFGVDGGVRRLSWPG